MNNETWKNVITIVQIVGITFKSVKAASEILHLIICNY